MPVWIAVLVGGGCGSLARHAVNIALTRAAGAPGPYSTATVNIVGCAIIGTLAGLVAGDSLRLTTAQRAFVFVGVLGGFTTFSSFALDTLILAQEGRLLAAMLNVSVQLGAGLAAVFAGYAIAVAI